MPCRPSLSSIKPSPLRPIGNTKTGMIRNWPACTMRTSSWRRSWPRYVYRRSNFCSRLIRNHCRTASSVAQSLNFVSSWAICSWRPRPLLPFEQICRRKPPEESRCGTIFRFALLNFTRAQLKCWQCRKLEGKLSRALKDNRSLQAEVSRLQSLDAASLEQVIGK